jgi:hypothetical protein
VCVGEMCGFSVIAEVSKVFDNNPEGSRLRGRPKTNFGIVYKHINKCHITNWKRDQKRIWREKSIKEAKVRIGCSAI